MWPVKPTVMRSSSPLDRSRGWSVRFLTGLPGGSARTNVESPLPSSSLLRVAVLLAILAVLGAAGCQKTTTNPKNETLKPDKDAVFAATLWKRKLREPQLPTTAHPLPLPLEAAS